MFINRRYESQVLHEKSGRGLPSCVLQEEKKTPNEIRAVRGTVKAAVLDILGRIGVKLMELSRISQKMSMRFIFGVPS